MEPSGQLFPEQQCMQTSVVSTIQPAEYGKSFTPEALESNQLLPDHWLLYARLHVTAKLLWAANNSSAFHWKLIQDAKEIQDTGPVSDGMLCYRGSIIYRSRT